MMMKVKVYVILLVVLTCVSPEATADTVDVREWLVPWEKSRPTDVYVDARGRVWFVGEAGHYLAWRWIATIASGWWKPATYPIGWLVLTPVAKHS